MLRSFVILRILAIAKDPLLSPQIIVGTCRFNSPSSQYRFLNQHASHDASERATYLAAIDDNALEICLLEHQLIAPLPAMKMYPVVDLSSSPFM